MGNIDTKNMSLLAETGLDTSIQFRDGAYMAFSFNHKKHHDFRPIFCANKTNGAKLLKAYFELV